MPYEHQIALCTSERTFKGSPAARGSWEDHDELGDSMMKTERTQAAYRGESGGNGEDVEDPLNKTAINSYCYYIL